MKTARSVAATIAAFAVIAAIAYGVYSLGVSRGRDMAGAAPMASDQSGRGILKPGDIDPATGKRVLYWHDPMVPGRRFDKPGKSPFMDMLLVPVYADGSDGGGVAVSPRIQQNLGIRTAEVVEATLAPRVEAVGTVAYNERDQVVVQARADRLRREAARARDARSCQQRASRSPICTCPTGSPRRRSSSRFGGATEPISRRSSMPRASACAKPA